MAQMTWLLSLPLALSLSHITAAQNSTFASCGGSLAYNSHYSIDTANATGVYEFPGVLVQNRSKLTSSNDPSQRWTLTQTVTRDASNKNITVGNSYLTIPSSSNSSDREQYVTCGRIFSIPDDVASARQADDGSCSTVFGADCVRDLKDLHQRQATAWAAQAHPFNTFCAGFWDTVKTSDYPASCRSSSGEFARAPQALLTDPDAIRPTNTTQSTCPNPVLVEFFDTHSWSELGVGDALSAAPKDPADFSVYNAAVRSIRPFFFVRIANATTRPDDSYADVQMVCARAKDVKAGSRAPDTVKSSAAAVRVSGWIVCLATLIGAVVAL
ncbi:MAG: hypothetical protein M1816_002187 [Peltula sp. TS41687]|nr:MAG: hypothetical protein M1816_002187 [Peltula sp. TS41687]